MRNFILLFPHISSCCKMRHVSWELDVYKKWMLSVSPGRGGLWAVHLANDQGVGNEESGDLQHNHGPIHSKRDSTMHQVLQLTHSSNKFSNHQRKLIYTKTNIHSCLIFFCCWEEEEKMLPVTSQRGGLTFTHISACQYLTVEHLLPPHKILSQLSHITISPHPPTHNSLLLQDALFLQNILPRAQDR